MHFKHNFPDYEVDQIGECIAFFNDFFVRFQIAYFIRYNAKVVPEALSLHDIKTAQNSIRRL